MQYCSLKWYKWYQNSPLRQQVRKILWDLEILHQSTEYKRCSQELNFHGMVYKEESILPHHNSTFSPLFIANSRAFFACMQPFSTQWAETLIKGKKNVEFRETALFAFVLILPTNCTHTLLNILINYRPISDASLQH